MPREIQERLEYIQRTMAQEGFRAKVTWDENTENYTATGTWHDTGDTETVVCNIGSDDDVMIFTDEDGIDMFIMDIPEDWDGTALDTVDFEDEDDEL